MSIQVRQENLLYGWREPVTPRPAATVILMRDGDDGLEILMTRRSMQASFAPGAYVFPGGRVDDADHQLASRLPHIQGGDELMIRDTGFTIAAIRESFEELGVLIARDPRGQHPDDALISAMNRAQDADFGAELLRHELTPDLDSIQWFSHWITDRDLPKRFDTRFFVARMPGGQQPVADEAEQFEPVWINPARGLAEHDAGRFAMIFPTIRTLRQLSEFGRADDVLDHCQGERKMWVSSPRGGLLKDTVARFSENETPFGELEMVTPDGQVKHRLDWQHEPVALLKHITRITAPNPGRMTGPGTNTYIVGAQDQFIVIDPGPDDAQHLARIAGVVGDKLTHIICTHSHPDHYPGAKPLRELVGKPNTPILGRPSGPHVNPAWLFEPDEILSDNDLIRCGEQITLRALHTPGHASNHVCLLLQEDGLLFSGDHILNGSTTVIDHPDGNMLDYMNALKRLAGEPVSFILPAHGHVLGQPGEVIDGLIRHRNKREQKVIAALEQSGGGNLDDLVVLAYDDVDKSLHPVAKRSLSAHLTKLVDEGRASHRDDRWALLS